MQQNPASPARRSKADARGSADAPASGLLSQASLERLLVDVEQYYTQKVTAHGATPLGVDWSCMPTQEMRFVQLLKLCSFDSPILLNDIGCGYGALLAFLAKRFRSKAVDYLGMDLSPAMIAQARQRWRRRHQTEFAVGSISPRNADYSIASGIFNVKLTQTADVWEHFIAKTLTDMHTTSRRGFAVNFLTPLPAHAPELYCVHPDIWREHCQRMFNCKVEVISGYGMREYTLLVRNS